jgi:hypothetical protein
LKKYLNNPFVRGILWIVLMIGWPLLLVEIATLFDQLLDSDSSSFNIGFAGVVIVRGGMLIGWVAITYLFIGKKSAIGLVLFFVVFYISPLPLRIGSNEPDCGPIPDWKCRWTCKSKRELMELGIGHPYVSTAFWRDNPEVIKAGGLCG